MKKFILLATLLSIVSTIANAATLTSGKDYYIWLNIYEKLLGDNEESTGPAISAFGTKSDNQSYMFTAEDSGREGFVLLRQKSSGRYLAASSANGYSVVFESARSTEDRYLWAVDEGTYVYLKNRKSGKYLGVDGANKKSTYVSVFYDKPRGSHSQFTAIPAVGNSWNDARAAYVSETYTNAQGVHEVDYCLVRDLNIDRSDSVDIHITANETPIQGSSRINLGSEATWLILDNIAPSAATNYLKYVTINGRKATKDSNCRIAIFLNGAAIIPLPKNIMSCQSIIGEFYLSASNYGDLKDLSNTMVSFTLHRGYMVTLAAGTKGSGHSRVYVADHSDLTVTLPEALALRVSSANVKPWQYLSKKGWANTGGATQGSELRASWYWSWSAGYTSTTDMEYVPCRQHLYWPSASDVNYKTATASMSLNEPEHSEQHTSDKCSCGGTINEWSAYKLSPDFQAGGGRIGSPQPTDFNYLSNFCKYVDENNNESRCDFVITHAYWNISGRDETSYANWFVDQCKTIWNSTKRPVWLTEMEVGSSWGDHLDSNEKYRRYLQVLLQRMEECDWIERYAIYAYDYWTSYLYYDANPSKGITPAGQVYRDHRSTFAYNAKYTKTPVWWTPSAKAPSFKVMKNESKGTLKFTITNPNGDLTQSIVVEHQLPNLTWEIIAQSEERQLFDNTTQIIDGIDATGMDLDTDLFRVTVTTLSGKTVSSGSGDASYLDNPIIETSAQNEVEGWNCSRDAANGFTKGTGDTYFEVWDATAANINFDYYQELTELESGVYQLSANVFNTADNVVGATVNGAVGLYALTSMQLYFAPVTTDASHDPDHPLISTSTDISDLPRLVIDTIVVTDGKLRVGVRNLGVMTARWAGADNFQLRRIGNVKDFNVNIARAENDLAIYGLLPAENPEAAIIDVPRDASRFIVNPDCNRKSSYGWTTTNVDYKTDAESYDGQASNSYWNIWKSGAFDSSLKQVIQGLPEGTYTFSALLRGRNTATLTLTAATPSTSVEQSFTGQGAESVAGADYPNGWQLITTPSIKVRRGQSLTISLDAKCSATAWWSADHFALTLVTIPSERVVVESLPTTKEATGLFDLSGRRISSGSVLHPGIYLLNGKKIYIK